MTKIQEFGTPDYIRSSTPWVKKEWKINSNHNINRFLIIILPWICAMRCWRHVFSLCWSHSKISTTILFNDIPISYGLFNAEILLIGEWLITVITFNALFQPFLKVPFYLSIIFVCFQFLGFKVATFLTPRCSSYWKGSLQVALDYGRQPYLLFLSNRNKPHIVAYYQIFSYDSNNSYRILKFK